MAIPQQRVDEIMAKCGRHCCICRRFEPLHLQVNHIIPLSEGGTDDADNLIPVCLTCHSDVHTQTTLTRRFSVEELKQDREMTFQLVREGRLPSAPSNEDVIEAALAKVLAVLAMAPRAAPLRLDDSDLGPAAIRILVEAARSDDGMVYRVRTCDGLELSANGKNLCDRGNLRSEAEYEDAIDRLIMLGLLRGTPGTDGVCRITHQGYRFADYVLAAGA